jgi:hypothetical protein
METEERLSVYAFVRTHTPDAQDEGRTNHEIGKSQRTPQCMSFAENS